MSHLLNIAPEVASAPCILPFLTVVMPCRNEAAHIRRTLGSILRFDYPARMLEIFVVDGMSDDGTREILKELAAAEPRVALFDNPDRLPARAMNLALDGASGEVILRVDAHTVYPSDYARGCVETLLQTDADNVGGVCETAPGSDTAFARAIAFAMAHPFGVGNAHFRVGVRRRRWVDTVPFGCWRRSRLLLLGGFATDLPYAEDDELNARLLKAGGKILLDPAIRSTYIARANLRQLMTMLFRYGSAKPAVAQRLGGATTVRQFVPPAFVLLVAGCLGMAPLMPSAGAVGLGTLLLHLAAGLAVAASAVRSLDPAAASLLPAIFLCMHLAYGAGYLIGGAKVAGQRAMRTSSSAPLEGS